MPKILLCEDDLAVAQVLTIGLKKKHEVIHARDGQAAVEKAIAEIPDLILMDMTLPLKDGDVAAREIRANPGTHHIPIIPFTAMSPGAKLAELEAEFGRVIKKPFRIADVLVVIEEVTAPTS